MMLRGFQRKDLSPPPHVMSTLKLPDKVSATNYTRLDRRKHVNTVEKVMHAGEKNGQARLRKIEGRAEGFCMEMVRPYIVSRITRIQKCM
jgi:hypothetical protein